MAIKVLGNATCIFINRRSREKEGQGDPGKGPLAFLSSTLSSLVQDIAVYAETSICARGGSHHHVPAAGAMLHTNKALLLSRVLQDGWEPKESQDWLVIM